MPVPRDGRTLPPAKRPRRRAADGAASGEPAGELPAAAGDALMRRPGVLIRRLHQVHSAMFQEETAEFGVTPVQYSLLTLLSERPGLEQGAAAAGLRLDRFTTADVVRRLEAAGLVRTRPGKDRRAKALFLTATGAATFAAMRDGVQRAHDRLLAPLPERRRGPFLRVLRELADHHGGLGTPPPKVR